jgi:hypothetical protein
MTQIKRYQLETAFVSLKEFDVIAKPDDFMEVSLWYNGEGFDVILSTNGEQRFCLTWGQFKALKKIIKELDG